MKDAKIPCDMLIKGKIVVTQDDRRRVLDKASIVIIADKIMAIGETESTLEKYAPEKLLDFSNCLIMPGLVNGHTHIAMTFLRGLADDLPLMDWLNNLIFPVEKHITGKLVELATTLGCAEMMRTGTTTFCDMYLLEDSVCQAVDRTGLRILSGEGLYAFPTPGYKNTNEAFDLVRAQAGKWKHHPRIRISVAPAQVYSTNVEILKKSGELARELNLPLQIHMAETNDETAITLKNHKKRPLAFYHDTGVLDSNTILAHCVHLNDAELGLVAKTGASIVHNPKSNMKLVSGVAPVPAMLKKGITVGLGTDGPASNNTLNLFSEMSHAALLHKLTSNDATALPAQAVLDMATRGSAAALDWPELGQLTVGGPADIVALDLTQPNLHPTYNPISNLVYATTGHEVRMCMVDGTILYQDGTYTTIDYPSLLHEIESIKTWVKGLLS